ncbi:MAG TPA: hypothetical protein VFR61_03025 [Nitrososphaeraceae archaeon]|jgi:hypothetical protein|nr:hypothetical protein [Nitrososphaeraceae archaeon]
MQNRINDCVLLFLLVSMALTVTSLGILVQNTNAQDQLSNNTEANVTISKDKVIVQTFDNLSNFFGTPMFFETSHNSIGSITISTTPLKTQDSYNATGVLRDVGNVTEMATFVTTHLADGKSTSIGKGNFTTSDGDIANYTGQDVGNTDSNGIETYKGIQIFSSNPEGKLGFLDNAIGIYVYKYLPNGTTTGTIWEWK